MSSGKILKTLTSAMYVNNQIYEPQKIDRVIFLSSSDVFTEFKDSHTLSFPKFSKSGNTDLNENVYSGTASKLKISVNLVYRWINMQYAPRFSLEIVKNNIVDKRRSLGISDTYEDENILDEYFIINIRDGDQIEVRLTKDNDELNYVRLEENAYLEFEAF